MFHKINDVIPYANHLLYVRFAEGAMKVYDMNRLGSIFPVFARLLETPSLFNKARVDVGGYGVIWNDDIDLSCDELWKNGSTVETPFDGLMAFSDATLLWGLSESTLRKAVSYGKLKPGEDVCKFGKQWVVTVAAMNREYGKAAS